MAEIVDRGIVHPSSTRRRKSTKPLLILMLFIGVGAAVYIGTVETGGEQAPSPPPSTVPVTVEPVTTRDLPIWRSGIGTVQPLNMVSVKVRVDGQLMRVAFAEGQEVRAGDVLAQIDPRPFQAQLAVARANRVKDEAQLGIAHLDANRASRLASTGSGTVQNAEATRAQVASLEAAVAADQAQIDLAQLNLDFTTVRSPIEGRVGLRQVDPGTIVHVSDGNGFVTVTQMQPISVVFSLPQDDLPEILEAQANGKARVAVDMRDGIHQIAEGTLEVIDSQIDPASGQVRLKALFNNGDRALWPGEFVLVRVLTRIEKGATVVPTRTIQHGQSGPYVYRANPGSTVAVQPIQTGPTVEGYTMVSGVTSGDAVVVSGQGRLTPAARIEVVEPAPDAPAPERAR